MNGQVENRGPYGEVPAQSAPPASATAMRPGWKAYPVTMAIIAINVAIFLLVDATGGTSTGNLLRWGADFGPRTLSGEWWRMLASTFLHGGFLHIGFNMLALWSLGPLVEKIVGRAAYLLAYLACGLGGSLLSLWWHPMIVSIGASGAIFGIAGVLMSVLYLKHLPIPKEYLKKNLWSVGAFIAYNLVFGAVAHGVDNAAHLGGLITGLLVGAALVPAFDRRASALRRYAVFPLFAVALAGGTTLAQRGSKAMAEFAAGSDLVEQQKFEAAIPHLQQAVKMQPGNADAQFQLAYAYLKLGRMNEAQRPMAEAVRLRPGDFAAQYDLGVIYFNLNRPADAIPHLKAAVDKSSNAAGWYFLGLCYLQTNQGQPALDAMKKSLAIEPKGKNADSARRTIELLEQAPGSEPENK
jgi:rhomboid protease GluP